MEKLVNINKLNFSYKKGTELFYNLNLTISVGHIHGLLGKNGEGKTTLLKLICGLLFPNEGSIEIMESEPRHRQARMLINTFFLPEELLQTSLSIKGFVKTYMSFYPKFSIGKFEGNLNEFSIDIDTKDISILSYGQRKKMLIAFAFATNARLILLDEPTNGLDIPSKNQFQRMVDASITENSAIIISTHQVADLEGIIDNVIIMDNHQIVFNETTEKISEKLQFISEDTKSYTDDTLYEEEIISGFKKLTENSTHEKSKLDIELLYNAVISEGAIMSKIFST
jgi:ABC-2 type transport system ATP-binding protein